MKVVIAGYCEMFSSLITGVINSGHEVVGVFRNENIQYSPLKRFLLDIFLPTDDFVFIKNLELYDIKAPSINSSEFIQELENLDADILLVGSWSEKIKKETIQTPYIACINTHPSLLPKYRGPNPYIQTILNGENVSGITFHLIDEKLDTGNILHQAKTDISEYDTGYSLKLKCCELARKEIGVLLNNIEEKIKHSKSQNENEASYQKQVELKETILDFEKETSVEIERKIRAFYPWLRCYIPYKNEFFEFDKYKISDKTYSAKAGSIVYKTSTSVGIMCCDNKVMEFSKLKLKRLILRLFTKLYLKYFVV